MDDDRRHRELDRRREMEAGVDLEKEAENYRRKYGKRATAKGLADTAVVPKRLLLPSVEDPSIWAVRCKEGKEREVVFSVMRKIEERLGTKNELPITAAFERGGTQSVMKGYVYVEAQRQNDIMIALDGIMNVYPRTKMILVEIKDMPDLLRVAKSPNLEPGAWVRLRRPMKHAGDLAQVLDVTENGLEARVRFIPRLDYGVRDASANVTADGKRKRPGVPGPRPPQRLFSEIEARKRDPRHIQGNPQTNTWTYNGDDFENGFQVKDIKIQQLDVKDVNPTLEEVTKFASGAEDGTENLDLRALAASLKDSNTKVTYVPGDVIEVYSGEQRGVVGKATNVQGDIVTLQVTEGPLKGQMIEVPNKGLRKRFRPGDHVKVIGGSRFRDEVGMVVKIVEDRVTLLTDQSHTEVTVFSKDLREADDTGGQGSLGQYSLLDLVQLDPATVGCIVKVDRESLVVLDQNGDTRQIMPSQITNKLPKRKMAVAADRNGSEIRLDDIVREYGGQQRQGKIIHIHRSYIYLHSNATSENAGVFVTRSSNVNTIAAKGGRINAASAGPDLDTMNPALKRNPGGSNNMQPPKAMGMDRSINQTVTIRRGGYKGLLGIVKDATDTHCRVELHTKGKIITVPKADLVFKDKVTGRVIDINSRGGRGGHGAGGRGGSNGDWSGGSRTPVVSGGAERTPAWGSSKGMLCSVETFCPSGDPKLTVSQRHRILLLGIVMCRARAHPPGETALEPSTHTMEAGLHMAAQPRMEEAPEHPLGRPVPRHQPMAQATPGAPDPRHQPTASPPQLPVQAVQATRGDIRPVRVARRTRTMHLHLVSALAPQPRQRSTPQLPARTRLQPRLLSVHPRPVPGKAAGVLIPHRLLPLPRQHQLRVVVTTARRPRVRMAARRRRQPRAVHGIPTMTEGRSPQMVRLGAS